MNRGARAEPTPPECALAAEMFDHFCSAATMKQILALHREICDTLTLKPNRLPDFYPKLKDKLSSSWKAQALFKKFDARVSHKVYAKGRACSSGRVLIIGAGPCGMRAAIECQLLGAKVVVIEKRDRMSRNNVLHLWPFVIQDLKALGAKKFFGKFCAGSIDHISIRQLQCILMKVALLLGVELHEGVSFEELLEPTISENSETLGWRARVLPADHPVSQYEFDSLLGADGKRNTLSGFKRKEFRGKLAMAITANFINRHSEQEASVPEISGVAFIFNQKFFKELYEVTGIDLENIVYYKDDTHYFVMTAKKHSLLDKGVLLNDYSEVSRLLSVENVDRGALMRYAQEAARFSTDGRLPLRDFALNHYGEPDIALFDFTSMYAAENASVVFERRGRRLLCQLVGDSLLEPFWPTGSGCARGFLSALDAAWAVRAWGQSPAPHPLEVVAERESIYRLLAQTTPENLHRDFGAYTLDPGTRYPNLNRVAVTPHRVTSYYDSDEPLPLDAAAALRKRRRESDVADEVLISWVGCGEGGLRAAVAPAALVSLLRRYRPDLLPAATPPLAVYHVLHHELGIPPFSSGGTMRDVSDAKVRSYLTRVYNAFKGEIPHVHRESDAFDQIKQSIQKDKHLRNTADHSVSAYSNAAETDKSHSSYKRKRRMRTPQVSTDSAEYICKKIGKLDLNDITQLTRLIEGHDNIAQEDKKQLQEQISAIHNLGESPNPKVLRNSLNCLLQGNTKTNLRQQSINNFFQSKAKSVAKPQRRLKGLAANTLKIINIDDSDSDIEIIENNSKSPLPHRRRKISDSTNDSFKEPKPVEMSRQKSESALPNKTRRYSIIPQTVRHSVSSDVVKRSNSFSTSEVSKTKRIAQLFESNKGDKNINIDDSDSDTTVKEKHSERALPHKARRFSDTPQAVRHSESPDVDMQSNSIGPSEGSKTKRIAQLFEENKIDNSDSDTTVKEKDSKIPLPHRGRRLSENTNNSYKELKQVEMFSQKSELAPSNKGRRFSDTPQRVRHSESPDDDKRSYSPGPSEVPNTKRIAQLFEGNKMDAHSPDGQRSVRSGSMTNEMSLRLQRMSDMINGKGQKTPSPERITPESIGNPELEIRKQRLVDLIKSQHKPIPPAEMQRRGSGETSSRMQRVFDIMQKRKEEAKRPYGGRRKAAREIMKQRFEKSVQMLAAEQPLDVSSATSDLDHDYGLQQYRASAPEFTERVQKLERQLQHYEEGRIVSGGGRNVGGGARVAKLAAELSGTSNTASTPRASKPKDLMRSVGKIERDDWNMKKIERKIQENRLGRPEPKTAEKVPKWDREQFLGRQRRLKEGDTDDKWGEIDETLQKYDQKLRDSGRPDFGTKKVANLAIKFVKKDVTPDKTKEDAAKDEPRKSWRGPATAGVQCAACGTRVFAAEGVTADGLQLHRACFRCAVCKSVLRPGNYTMERYGSRLVCLRHSGVHLTDGRADPTPERISIELSDGAREIDEDEWTDRNCLASETSTAGQLSDEEESSSDEYTDAGMSENEEEAAMPPAPAPPRDMYFSDDSFGYDDFSDTGAESSGNESSRMRAAREARRREVPADARAPTYSSEVDSDESSSSDSEISSATEVSTDSEFAREDTAPPSPPAILVTEPAPPAPPPHTDYPLSRARSAGGLATKRALELKRKYLLGEPSPPAVRKSDSTSQIDTEAFRSNITEFQKLLNPAPPQPIICNIYVDKKPPMPDIIKSILTDAPVDLLTKADSMIKGYISEKSEPIPEKKENEPDLDSDSLSEDTSHTETAPKSVPRVEVHDEGGELIQLDSLTIVSEENEKQSATATATGPTVLAAESESSESGRDATTLALTETELSDWAAEGALDECGFEKEDRKRSKNPRTLSGPKLIHDAKNIAAVTSHVCGRTSPEPIVFSNALEHFEFADEGEPDPSLDTPTIPRNEGYMELVDDDIYSPGNDRSMNFIERSFSETVMRPSSLEPLSHTEIVHTIPKEIEEQYAQKPKQKNENESEISSSDTKVTDKTDSNLSSSKTDDRITEVTSDSKLDLNGLEPSIESLSLTEVSPPSHALTNKTTTESESFDDISPPLIPETPTSKTNSIFSNISLPASTLASVSGVSSMRLYSPAICRSASETFNRSTSRSTDSPSRSFELSVSVTLSSGSVSPISPIPPRDTIEKVQEIKRERDEQTEVVRRLVLERLGSGPRVPKKTTRRMRISAPLGAPPVPPPPVLPDPPAPPRPAPPLIPLPVTPSFSDPELARERRRKSIMKSISNYLNRHLGPRQKWASEPNLSTHEPTPRPVNNTHKSMGALQAPPVPPPPASYTPPENSERPHSSRISGTSNPRGRGAGVDTEERDAMQLWFEARWARLVAQRRSREEPLDERARRVRRLERRLSRPLSAQQQAATVAELVQMTAQRDAHIALMNADRRRSAASGAGGD